MLQTERSLHAPFQVLSRSPKTSDQACMVPIPDTLYYQHGSLRLWYSSDNGEVVKRDKRECTKERIMQVFCGESPNSRTPEPGMPVAVYMHYSANATALNATGKDCGTPGHNNGSCSCSSVNKWWPDCEPLSIDFFDRDLLSNFLATRDNKDNTIVQKFLLNSSQHASTIQVVWSPSKAIPMVRQNINNINDTQIPLRDRCATDESCVFSREVKATPRMLAVMNELCQKIVDHWYLIEQRQIMRMIAFFCFDRDRRPVFQWCSEVQLTSQPMSLADATKRAQANTKRSLLQLSPSIARSDVIFNQTALMMQHAHEGSATTSKKRMGLRLGIQQHSGTRIASALCDVPNTVEDVISALDKKFDSAKASVSAENEVVTSLSHPHKASMSRLSLLARSKRSVTPSSFTMPEDTSIYSQPGGRGKYGKKFYSAFVRPKSATPSSSTQQQPTKAFLKPSTIKRPASSHLIRKASSKRKGGTQGEGDETLNDTSLDISLAHLKETKEQLESTATSRALRSSAKAALALSTIANESGFQLYDEGRKGVSAFSQSHPDSEGAVEGADRTLGLDGSTYSSSSNLNRFMNENEHHRQLDLYWPMLNRDISPYYITVERCFEQFMQLISDLGQSVMIHCAGTLHGGGRYSSRLGSDEPKMVVEAFLGRHPKVPSEMLKILERAVLLLGVTVTNESVSAPQQRGKGRKKSFSGSSEELRKRASSSKELLGGVGTNVQLHLHPHRETCRNLALKLRALEKAAHEASVAHLLILCRRLEEAVRTECVSYLETHLHTIIDPDSQPARFYAELQQHAKVVAAKVEASRSKSPSGDKDSGGRRTSTHPKRGSGGGGTGTKGKGTSSPLELSGRGTTVSICTEELSMSGGRTILDAREVDDSYTSGLTADTVIQWDSPFFGDLSTEETIEELHDLYEAVRSETHRLSNAQLQLEGTTHPDEGTQGAAANCTVVMAPSAGQRRRSEGRLDRRRSFAKVSCSAPFAALLLSEWEGAAVASEEEGFGYIIGVPYPSKCLAASFHTVPTSVASAAVTTVEWTPSSRTPPSLSPTQSPAQRPLVF